MMGLPLRGCRNRHILWKKNSSLPLTGWMEILRVSRNMASTASAQGFANSCRCQYRRLIRHHDYYSHNGFPDWQLTSPSTNNHTPATQSIVASFIATTTALLVVPKAELKIWNFDYNMTRSTNQNLKYFEGDRVCASQRSMQHARREQIPGMDKHCPQRPRIQWRPGQAPDLCKLPTVGAHAGLRDAFVWWQSAGIVPHPHRVWFLGGICFSSIRSAQHSFVGFLFHGVCGCCSCRCLRSIGGCFCLCGLRPENTKTRSPLGHQNTQETPCRVRFKQFPSMDRTQ